MSRFSALLLVALFSVSTGCATVQSVVDWWNRNVPPPVEEPVEPPAPPVDSYCPALDKVNWVGASPATYMVSKEATLQRVQIKLPQVCWQVAAWPMVWPPYKNRTGKANANMVVIAKINDEWWGAPWEALDHRYNGTGPACRKLEAITNNTGEGPFGQAEGPFVNYYPKSGEKLCMVLTTWVRHHEVPNGVRERSEMVEFIWP